MSFLNTFRQYSWNQIEDHIHSTPTTDVLRILSRGKPCSWQDFLALLSPAAEPYLEEMAALSRKITLARFGRTIQLYAPMYLSNRCHNVCRYCGFSAKNKIQRVALNPRQVLDEATVLHNLGHRHILLVSGETRKTAFHYIMRSLETVAPLFANTAIETQPFETNEYTTLINKGLNGVYLYQETYNQSRYPYYHVSGTKSDFHHRLLTHDKAGSAGVNKLGLGVLLGLEDWRTDSGFLALHLAHLEKAYWRSHFSISFPRLRHAQGNTIGREVSDRHLVQLICAYRIRHPNVDLVLSTRESSAFRNHAIHFGITCMSADSKTAPGAYTLGGALEQFSIDDERSAQAVAESLSQQGYQAIWKDWDHLLDHSPVRSPTC